MSYITTASGIHFDPLEPDPELIKLEDIAHALSFMARANGHMRIVYTVAQHSIACAREAIARGCSRETVLGCLLHDASEAYICDVTRPVKKELPFYLEIEDRLQNIIWKKLIGRDLTDEERRIIFEIDDEMLSLEFHQLMPEDIGTDYEKLVRDIRCEYEDPLNVRQEFMDLYFQSASL